MLSVLKNYTFFDSCGKSIRNQIIAKSTLIRVAAGTELFARNEHCESVMFLGRGSVRVFTLSPVGKEVTLYHLGSGDICPVSVLSALSNKPASAYAKALSELYAVKMPARYFRKCVNENSVIRDFAFSAIADRVTDVIDLVERITFCTLEQRLANFLCCQFTRLGNSEPMVLTLTHEQIASELGSAREVISRALRDMERRGSVSLGRGQIRLADINLLKNIDKIKHH